MEREMMLQKLMELDFLAVDLGLYLNTHPTETEAINAYNQTIEAADLSLIHISEPTRP